MCPTLTFGDQPIYLPGREVTATEIDARIEQYWQPYHQRLVAELKAMRQRHGYALLWDAHSIRRVVKTIRQDPFPEMILGDNDEKSADKKLIDITLSALKKGYQVNHNDPFKGGHITRYFGKPAENVHALQLERNKNLYMDDAERKFDEARSNRMRGFLKANFEKLIEALG